MKIREGKWSDIEASNVPCFHVDADDGVSVAVFYNGYRARDYTALEARCQKAEKDLQDLQELGEKARDLLSYTDDRKCQMLQLRDAVIAASKPAQDLDAVTCDAHCAQFALNEQCLDYRKRWRVRAERAEKVLQKLGKTAKNTLGLYDIYTGMARTELQTQQVFDAIITTLQAVIAAADALERAENE